MSDNDKAHDQLQSLLWGFASHRVITVAGRTGILRTLADGTPRAIDVISETCGLKTRPVGKIVRALTALGLLTADGDLYGMTPQMASLFQPGPMDMTHFLEHSHDMYSGWGENLENWLRGGEWTTRPRDSDGAKRFARAMQAMGGHVARRLAGMVDLGGAQWMLDVGGGVGHFAEAFCEANPDVEVVVLDREEVAVMGRQRIDGTPFEERIHFVGGDYLETLAGMNFDFVLIANVLHQETETNAAELVLKAAQALNSGGTLAVLDFSIDESQRDSVVGALFAINMRSFGDTYTESTIRRWMDHCGLQDFTRTDVGPHRWLLTAKRP